ncbi:hypothetical protein ABIB62_004123 [Mucilaginibacter sp. UYP25]|uniref:S1 family peptidase n=1 Tax=unclassified Mucilaginibacter TaxID=2617802 RepID=UPI0033988286
MGLTVTERLTYSTVRIECENEKGISTGTGFFFKFFDDGKTHIPVVVTNKHVIEGAMNGRLTFTRSSADNTPLDTQHFPITLGNFESLWRKHPDANVDLCAMPIAPYLNEANSRGQKLYYDPLDKSIIPTKDQLTELDALEEIIMIGYPNGIWDSKNNKPIFRKGITATHPVFDYNGKKEILIDAACFPGSSGSPVLILNQGGYKDKKGTFIVGQVRIFLLGVLYAGPQYTTQGEIKVVDIPTTNQSVSLLRIPINLGVIIKSERIIELEKLFDN